MKMPTAIVRQRGQWKPGEHVSYPYGEGLLSVEERLPLVSTGNESYTPVPRVLRGDSGREKADAEEGVTSSAPPTGGGERAERGKRFPILGPTRQETEMYFRRRRRSAKERLRTESRPLVTRSADGVLLANSMATRLAHTPFSTTNKTTNRVSTATTATSTTNDSPPTTDKPFNTNGLDRVGQTENGKDQHEDTYQANNTLLSSHTEDPSQPSVPFLPGFELPVTPRPTATTSPTPEHLPNSPTNAVGVSLPLPLFDHHSPGPRGAHAVRGRRTSWKAEAPVRILPESGPVRALEPSQWTGGHKNGPQKGEPYQKTLQPSKYGFHRRSKSPTFKRLVDAAERLQGAAPDSDSDSQHMDKCQLCQHHGGRVYSPCGLRLPAVAGVWDGAEVDGGDGGEAGEDEVSYLCQHDFLSSLPHRLHHHRSRHTRTVGTSTIRRGSKQQQVKGEDEVAMDEVDLGKGWGAWEVDDVSVGSGVTVPLAALTASDNHTELHLFLPRLADTASDDGSCKPSPDRHRHRPGLLRHPAVDTAAYRGRAGKEVSPVQHLTHPRPQPPAPQQWARERCSRSQEKRFTSPVRTGKRDRTPKRRPAVNGAGGGASSPLEVYVSYEPYVKGEYLKEKLEDFPTLISLEHDS